MSKMPVYAEKICDMLTLLKYAEKKMWQYVKYAAVAHSQKTDVPMRCWLLWYVVRGDGTRWRYSDCPTAAAECRQFNTQHVQLGCSPTELHGNLQHVLVLYY